MVLKISFLETNTMLQLKIWGPHGPLLGKVGGPMGPHRPQRRAGGGTPPHLGTLPKAQGPPLGPPQRGAKLVPISDPKRM